MRISLRVDYALLCALRIAEKSLNGAPVTVACIAKIEKLHSDYVEQLLMAMKRHGILSSIRGKKGGYVFSMPLDKVSVKDIMMAIEKKVLEPVCGRKKGKKHKCIYMDDCRMKSLWNRLSEVIEGFLSGYTMDKLLEMRRNEPEGIAGVNEI
jgi:Rrf2 family protein